MWKSLSYLIIHYDEPKMSSLETDQAYDVLLLITLSGGPGVPICEGLSLPLATNMALILAATAAAASRAPVGAASASPIPPEPEPGPGWSHLLRRLRKDRKKNTWQGDKTQAVGGEKGEPDWVGLWFCWCNVNPNYLCNICGWLLLMLWPRRSQTLDYSSSLSHDFYLIMVSRADTSAGTL